MVTQVHCDQWGIFCSGEIRRPAWRLCVGLVYRRV